MGPLRLDTFIFDILNHVLFCAHRADAAAHIDEIKNASSNPTLLEAKDLGLGDPGNCKVNFIFEKIKNFIKNFYFNV